MQGQIVATLLTSENLQQAIANLGELAGSLLAGSDVLGRWNNENEAILTQHQSGIAPLLFDGSEGNRHQFNLHLNGRASACHQSA